MSRGLPQLVKDAQRVRACVECMSTRMARRYRYSTGADLRAAAKTVVVAILRVWRKKGQAEKAALADALVETVDLLKLELQLGKEIGAFGSWKEFEAVVRLVDSVRQQSGWWRSRLRYNGQNDQAQPAPDQRAKTLSSRSASHAEAAL